MISIRSSSLDGRGLRKEEDYIWKRAPYRRGLHKEEGSYTTLVSRYGLGKGLTSLCDIWLFNTDQLFGHTSSGTGDFVPGCMEIIASMSIVLEIHSKPSTTSVALWGADTPVLRVSLQGHREYAYFRASACLV
jgi:hypothetical protein